VNLLICRYVLAFLCDFGGNGSPSPARERRRLNPPGGGAQGKRAARSGRTKADAILHLVGALMLDTNDELADAQSLERIVAGFSEGKRYPKRFLSLAKR
jgi:hypothetical protein